MPLTLIVIPVRNVGIKNQTARTYPLPKGDRGIAGISACDRAGRFVAIEVKRKGNMPSEDQWRF